jgi:hypothetical protein
MGVSTKGTAVNGTGNVNWAAAAVSAIPNATEANRSELANGDAEVARSTNDPEMTWLFIAGILAKCKPL